MKKVFALLLVITMLAVLILSAGCENAEPEVGKDVDTQAALQTIYDNAKAALPDTAFLPPTLGTKITNENCEGYLGMKSDKFEEYVMESYTLPAAISSHAFDLALVKCKDYASAKEVKKLIAEGFDPAKRICAVSEVAFVVESGRFVLLGGVAADTAEAFQKAFTENFSETKAGDVNKFFVRSEEGGLTPG